MKEGEDDGKGEARYWRLERFRKLSEKFVVLARKRTVLTDAEIAFVLYDRWRELHSDAFDPGLLGYDERTTHRGQLFREYLRSFLTTFNNRIPDERIASVGR